LFFKYTAGTQNTVNSTIGVDIRSDGGYVGIASSVIDYPETLTSGAYIWLNEPTPELLATLPEAPKWVLEAIYAPEVSLTPQQAYNASPDLTPGASSVGVGGRNNDISIYSLKQLNFFKGNQQEALRVVTARNLSFTEPLPFTEVKATFESAVRKYNISPPTSTGLNKEMLDTLEERALHFKPTSTADDINGAMLTLTQGKKRGVPTGFMELDSLTGGLLPGQTYLLYADTSVGKSVFAVNVLVNLARHKIRCLYFDLENDMTMSMERLMFVANQGAINLTDYRSQLLAKEVDMDFLQGAFAPVFDIKDYLKVWDLNKMTDRFGDINWEGVKTVMEEEAKNGLDVVVIDHLHYFSPAETDHAVLGEIARQLNNYAAQKNMSIVCVAHTKKGLIENKKGSDSDEIRAVRPTIEHIAGSSMISKHFKNLIAIQRNSMAPDSYTQSLTKVYVDKTKYGPAGHFELQYQADVLRFVTPKTSRVINDAKSNAINEMLDKAVALPLYDKEDDDAPLPLPRYDTIPGETKNDSYVPVENVSEIRKESKRVDSIRNASSYKVPVTEKVTDDYLKDIPF